MFQSTNINLLYLNFEHKLLGLVLIFIEQHDEKLGGLCPLKLPQNDTCMCVLVLYYRIYIKEIQMLILFIQRMYYQ